MLTLRLTLAAPPLALLLRLLLLCASAGVGLLLLNALSHALEHPRHPQAALVELAWCLAPLAVTAHLAAALARTEPCARARSGLDAAGLGPARLPLLAALTAAAPCALGGASALLVTAGAHGGPRDGGAPRLALPGVSAQLPLPGHPMPLPAALTLLSAVPLLAAVAAAWGTRADAASTPGGPGRGRGGTGTPVLVAAVLLTTAGLLLAGYAAHRSPDAAQAGPVRTGALRADPALWPPAVGWGLAALGLVLAGPGLAALSGRLLAGARPGPVRLLAGRTLAGEAPWTGGPLGTLSAVAATALVLVRARLAGAGMPAPGPLGTLAAVLVGCCAVGAALAALARARRTREPLGELLDRLGAPHRMWRAVRLVRTAATLAVFTAATLSVGLLAPLPPR
ncbi:hypothetical protein SALCHL_004892 [Streptomyces albus subsp. chlorinus]|uniref:hypothetical protein n=1 Tax=Streptomyces albus TaxID=1888 RepID=UPI003D0F1376